VAHNCNEILAQKMNNEPEFREKIKEEMDKAIASVTDVLKAEQEGEYQDFVMVGSFPAFLVSLAIEKGGGAKKCKTYNDLDVFWGIWSEEESAKMIVKKQEGKKIKAAENEKEINLVEVVNGSLRKLVGGCDINCCAVGFQVNILASFTLI
jgi:hypothetical protein